MRRFASLVAAGALVALAGCVSRASTPESAYVVNSQGAVTPIARSALAGSTAPGKQEIIGLYVPFVGTGLALKAGLEWDGTPVVVEVPVASQPQAAAAYQRRWVPRCGADAGTGQMARQTGMASGGGPSWRRAGGPWTSPRRRLMASVRSVVVRKR